MSWAEEDWTVGLSGRVLQKVKELQVHHERLSRENKQKQLQLDNIHTSLEKQVVKYEEVRGELQSVQRDFQSVREEAKAAVISRERLTQELQAKQAQVCSLEGQLDATRTLNNKLTQEVKRLEAELEKLHNRNRLADTTLFSTPCWSTPSPWEQNGSRKDEEWFEHRGQTQSQAPHVRQRLQFSDMPTNSLPKQHRSTPHHRFSDQLESFSTPLAAFPWERDDTRQMARRQSPSSPQTPCTDVISQGQPALEHLGMDKENRTEMDISLSEMQSRVSCLEEELSVKAKTITSIQSDLVQSKKELAARELSLQKARDELSLAHTRITQESERASGAELRLKQLQEELKCQRQNAESSRLQHQQRSKELEKQHQRDVTELQKERQWLEKQHQQEMNKLNQELQQARTLHNALQAQADKLSLQKQVLDKELDMLKEKVKWMEGQLQESQKKEAQTQAKLTEALREAEGVAVSLEQSRKRERSLEEEGRRLAEERADALRLLKDLQEQIAAPAPPQQPVQFCPVGQSLSPPPSHALRSRQISHTKKPTTTIQAEQKKEEEDVDERGAELSTHYPSEREPGEGIDSEHISTDSEGVQTEEHRRKSNGEKNDCRNEIIKCDSSGTKAHSTFGHEHSSVSHSAPDMYTNTSVDAYDCSVKHPSDGTPSLKNEQTKASEDLQRENAMLRSEINDVREELQKRLEDLEAQRRAEAEARARLKQLSRKHASQAVEKVEQEKEWRAKLESERAEVDRLKKAMAGLETEVKSRKEERDKEREEQEKKNKALEDGESEMIELNIQLKKQLADVKAQLALEREERQREDEERNQTSNLDIGVKKELSTKLSELQAEFKELKCSKKEDERAGEEKHLLANSPLAYLSLHDELNSNIGHCDNKLLLSPEQHLLFCQSTNRLNMLVSQGTAALIQKHSVMDPEGEGQAYQIPSDLEDTRQNCLGVTFLSDQRDDISHLQKCESAPSHLEKEVVRLQKEKAKETERANQNQVKLEALQSQVTRQTRQLTMAFEKQSQHISGLLAELHEKEIALFRQGEEMQQCKQELDALQAGKEVTKGQREGRLDLKLINSTVLQLNEENDCAVTFDTTCPPPDVGSTAQRDGNQSESDTRTPTHFSSGEDNEAPLLEDSEKTEGNHGSICRREETEYSQDDGAAHDATELLALRQENCLLNQRIESLTVTDTGGRALHTDTESKEDLLRQNSGNVVVSWSTEQGPSREENDITAEGQESLLQNEQREDGDLEREDKSTTRAEEVCSLQIKHLEQQVVALQVKLQALSEETQQQNEELALWRLASQPPPTFDQLLPNKDKHYQISAVGQALSNKQHKVEATYDPPGTKSEALADQIPVIQQSPSNVAVIREDELLLSCSSKKLQGQMLFSRLQNSNFSEPKSPQYIENTPACKEHNQDTVNTDKESEKEYQKRNILQSQHKDKLDAEVIQMPSEKTSQHVSKGPKTCHSENRVAKPKVSKASNETNTTNDSFKRAVGTETKSVSSQTEEILYPHSAPAASKLHSAYTQTEEVEIGLLDSPSVSPVHLSEGAESAEKMLFSGSFPIPADPARLAERIRRNRTQLSAAFDDTEYEPYGLPEVVMKGFADIPSGPSCPYIVRRGLLGTSVVPVPQKDADKEEETD